MTLLTATLERSAITGLILTGGAGRRVGGQDKGWLAPSAKHGACSQPLIIQTLERLVPQVGHILVSANRHLAEYATLGYPVIPDIENRDHDKATPAYLGPMAGLFSVCVSASEHWHTDWLCIVAVDSPNFPKDLVHRLSQTIATGTAATYATCAGNHFYTFGLFNRQAIPTLQGLYEQQSRSLRGFWQAIGAKTTDFDVSDWQNLNTLEAHWGPDVEPQTKA